MARLSRWFCAPSKLRQREQLLLGSYSVLTANSFTTVMLSVSGCSLPRLC
ncbi:hypothetical protein A2U01_0078294 [Trifolium medium]|uniref:Uncharacterized protein n=1 Tax=Trifolium medium TaxID=97028 RepID=A0A392T7F9_9FABA|nr:hypothetical protein [Trifolium medium]